MSKHTSLFRFMIPLLVLLVAFWSIPGCGGGTTGTGSLDVDGEVQRAETGEGIPGITVTDEESGATVVTAADGSFRFGTTFANLKTLRFTGEVDFRNRERVSIDACAELPVIDDARSVSARFLFSSNPDPDRRCTVTPVDIEYQDKSGNPISPTPPPTPNPTENPTTNPTAQPTPPQGNQGSDNTGGDTSGSVTTTSSGSGGSGGSFSSSFSSTSTTTSDSSGSMSTTTSTSTTAGETTATTTTSTGPGTASGSTMSSSSSSLSAVTTGGSGSAVTTTGDDTGGTSTALTTSGASTTGTTSGTGTGGSSGTATG